MRREVAGAVRSLAVAEGVGNSAFTGSRRDPGTCLWPPYFPRKPVERGMVLEGRKGKGREGLVDACVVQLIESVQCIPGLTLMPMINSE